MARPVTNKIREYIVKVKRKNGDIYVLQRQSRYDSEKKYAVTISEKLLGKIPKGGTELIATRAKRNKVAVDTSAQADNKESASRSYVGMLEILGWIAKRLVY